MLIISNSIVACINCDIPFRNQQPSSKVVMKKESIYSVLVQKKAHYKNYHTFQNQKKFFRVWNPSFFPESNPLDSSMFANFLPGLLHTSLNQLAEIPKTISKVEDGIWKCRLLVGNFEGRGGKLRRVCRGREKVLITPGMRFARGCGDVHDHAR